VITGRIDALEREIELCMFLAGAGGAGGAPTVGKGGAGSARPALDVAETRVKNSKRVLASRICMTNDSGRLCEWSEGLEVPNYIFLGGSRGRNEFNYSRSCANAEDIPLMN
jgi:hypothetical protein